MREYIDLYDKFRNEIIKIPGGTFYIHYSVIDEVIKDIIENGEYIILGYDGMLVNKKGTAGPMELVYAMVSYHAEKIYADKNMIALKTLPLFHEMIEKYIKSGGLSQYKDYDFNKDDIYVDLIIKKEGY